MAAPKSPTQKRKRFLPAISIDTNRATHYITYKSALGWMARNQPVFQKAFDLMRLYPTLKDHKCMESLKNVFSNHSEENKRDARFEHAIGRHERRRFRRQFPEASKSRKNSAETQTDERKHLPRISIIPETPSPSHDERLRITVIGLSLNCQPKWGNLIFSLSADSFIHCAQPSDLANEFLTTDAIVFIITDYGVQEKECVNFLGLASSRGIPMVFVREPGYQLPSSLSYSPDSFHNMVAQTHEQKNISTLKCSSNSSFTEIPTLGRTGYFKNESEQQPPDPLLITGYSVLVHRFKEAIVYSGTNVEFCAQTIANDIHESLDKRAQTPSAKSEDNFTFDTDNDALSPDRLTLPPYVATRESPPENDTPWDRNTESPLFTQIDRRVSIDSETVYILFPVNYKGESTGSPRYVHWPRRQSEDNMDDMEVSSISSELSVGFQDIDLSKPIYLDDITSDEEFNVHLQ